MNNYIFGTHISDLMNDLKEEEPTRFRLQFSTYINLQIKPEDISRLYEKVHGSIKKYPQKAKKPRSMTFPDEHQKRLIGACPSGRVHPLTGRCIKHTYEERKEKLKMKLALF